MLKGIIYLATISLLTVSCGSTRRMSRTDNAFETKRPTDNTVVVPAALPGKRVYKNVYGGSRLDPDKVPKKYPTLNFSGNIENSSWLQFKFALLTDVPVEALENINLLYYMQEWYGVPYHYGGSTKKGIDCSAFTLGLMAAVFNIMIPRTAREQFETTVRVERYELHEGDLVFFNTRGGISHVGIYVINNKFVHASASSGVMISDLDEDYYTKRYIGAGRVNN